jgi:signal transduction histidine kinase
MRERAAALDGELEVGPRKDGGFRVRARLPVDGNGSGGAG